MSVPREVFLLSPLRRAIAILVGLGIFGAPLARGNNPAEEMPCPVVTYTTNPNYPPYHWALGDQVFQGASIELLGMVLPPNVQAKPLVVPWKRALALAEEGKVDLLLSLRNTPERQIYLDFLQHRAFPNPIVVFVRQDRAFSFQSWKDLKGKRGGVSLGDTFGAGFDTYWRTELQIEEAPSLEENFKKLAAGRIDYFVSGLFPGKSYLDRQGLGKQIVAIGKPISNQDIYFAFSRKFICPALKAHLELRLEELDRKGVPERLLRKHLEIYARGHGSGR